MHPYKRRRRNPDKYVMQEGALYRWSNVFEGYVMAEPELYRGMHIKDAVRAHMRKLKERARA